MNAGVRIDQASLKALMSALKKADAELQKELKRELKGAANIVASAAKGKVPSRSGRAAGSIRSGGTARGAYVQGGKASVPYYGWLDFGSRTPRLGNPRSVGPWAGSGTGPRKGRFIYPALEDKRPEVQAAVRDAVSKSIDKLF